MSEWREASLGDVLTLQRGFDLPSRERVDGPYPIVSSSGVTGWHSEAKVDPPGVVIGRYGSLGSVHWVAQPFWPLNTALWVRDFKGNNPRYVSYLLKTIDVDSSSASAVPGVNRNHLHRLPVRVPSVPTQERIAATLAAFDEMIAISERRIEVLDDLAKALYREWFVRFRHSRGAEPTMVHSDLGPIPDGWRVAPIAEVASEERAAISSGPFGSKLGRKDYVQDGVPVIRGTNLALGGGFKDGDFVFVSEEKASTLSSSIARPGDIVITQRGTLGQVGLVPTTARFSTYVISQSQMKITTGPATSAQYVYAVLRSPEAERRILNMAISSGVPHINLALLRGMRIVVPPTAIQVEFEALVAPITELVAHHSDAIVRYAATRDLLLRRLVTGRLDISEVDLGDLIYPEIV